METKSKVTKLPFLLKTPPVFTTNGEQGFKGAFPPTGEDVILQYYGYHNYLQRATNRQSKNLDAIMLVLGDIKSWWARTGITILTHTCTKEKIIKVINEYKQRKRYQKKFTDSEVEKRNELVKDLKNTFWVVSPEYEKKLKQSTDTRDIFDWKYLEGVRGDVRTGTLGSFDGKLHTARNKTLKRKRLATQSLIERRNREQETTSHSVPWVSSSSSSDNSDDNGSDYTPPRKRTKLEAIPEELLLVAEKSQTSIRTTTQIISAFLKDKGYDLDNYNLSCMTTLRRQSSLRKKKATEIIEDHLSNKHQIWTLHWDGKIIKSLTHVGKDCEHVAILLTGTCGKEVLLSVIDIEGQSNAENETKQIIKVLQDYNIVFSNIAALVFDTTSLNTGNKQGIVVRLEAEFGRHILQLACRHHIYELVGGASCSVVYGATTGPKEPVFQKLIDNWESLDIKEYSTLKLTRQQRELSLLVEQAVLFLQDWLLNSCNSNLRHDYLQLATLSLLFLGGTLPDCMKHTTIKDPGAIHHARWMSKSLYTLKITLFRDQLEDVYEAEQLEEIYSLATFLSIFYTKAWLTCTSAADAPNNDLQLMKKLLTVEKSIISNSKPWPIKFLSLVSGARQKLEKHLGYLSERLVVLAVFSDHVSLPEKKKMQQALLKYQPAVSPVQKVPYSKNMAKKQLHDFVGSDSWTMFHLLEINSSFLNDPVSEWNNCDSYLHGKDVLSNLPVVNDAAERALGLATEMSTNKTPKSKEQKQDRYKVVKAVREELAKFKTSVETVTKKALKKINY